MNQLTVSRQQLLSIPFDFIDIIDPEELKDAIFEAYEIICDNPSEYEEDYHQIPTLSAIGKESSNIYIQEKLMTAYHYGEEIAGINVRENIDKYEGDEVCEIQESIAECFWHTLSYGMHIGDLYEYFSDVEKMLNLNNLTYRKDDGNEKISDIKTYVVEVW